MFRSVKEIYKQKKNAEARSEAILYGKIVEKVIQAAPDNEKLYNAAKLFKVLGKLEIVREQGLFVHCLNTSNSMVNFF